MPLAIVGAAVGIGGAVMASSAQRSAANRAAQAATDNTAANNVLAREVYAQNAQRLDPYAAQGVTATNAINALLGLSGQTGVASRGSYGTPPYWGGTPAYDEAPEPMANGNAVPNALSMWFQRHGGYQPQARPQPAPAPVQAVDPQAAQRNAFDAFRNSTGYQFRFNEGANAINAQYAAKGLLNSGAAQKALTRYGQDYGSNEFSNYMNMLLGQQGVGMQGASALAGVSQNNLAAQMQNNNAGASAVANAALMRGQSTANMWQGIAGGIGGLFGSSFGR